MEDNRVNRRVVEGVLSKHGHVVIAVENGAQAVEAAQAHYFDAILMDRHMPVMDGIEATRRIRGLRHGDMPIIALTAAATQDDVEACLNAGMDSFVAKPVDPDLLLAEIARLTEDRWHNTPRQPSAPDPAEQPPILDATALRHLEEHLGSEILPSLVQDFRLTAAELGQVVAESLASEDWRAMERSAHGLKSSAGSMGLIRLQKLCEAIELSCRREEMDKARNLAVLLPEAVTEAIRHLLAHVEGEASEP